MVWDLPGYRQLQGKEDFDAEIENPDFEGSPTLTVDRLVEEGDTVVALDVGQGHQRGGVVHRFAFSTAFTFRSGRICRVESLVVPLR